MANHGLCKNCWWWQQYPFTIAVGLCFMQASDKGVLGKPALSCDYCPDYVNRKNEEKREGTLRDWIRDNDLFTCMFCRHYACDERDPSACAGTVSGLKAGKVSPYDEPCKLFDLRHA